MTIIKNLIPSIFLIFCFFAHAEDDILLTQNANFKDKAAAIKELLLEKPTSAAASKFRAERLLNVLKLPGTNREISLLRKMAAKAFTVIVVEDQFPLGIAEIFTEKSADQTALPLPNLPYEEDLGLLQKIQEFFEGIHQSGGPLNGARETFFFGLRLLAVRVPAVKNRLVELVLQDEQSLAHMKLLTEEGERHFNPEKIIEAYHVTSKALGWILEKPTEDSKAERTVIAAYLKDLQSHFDIKFVQRLELSASITDTMPQIQKEIFISMMIDRIATVANLDHRSQKQSQIITEKLNFLQRTAELISSARVRMTVLSAYRAMLADHRHSQHAAILESVEDLLRISDIGEGPQDSRKISHRFDNIITRRFLTDSEEKSGEVSSHDYHGVREVLAAIFQTVEEGFKTYLSNGVKKELAIRLAEIKKFMPTADPIANDIASLQGALNEYLTHPLTEAAEAAAASSAARKSNSQTCQQLYPH